MINIDNLRIGDLITTGKNLLGSVSGNQIPPGVVMEIAEERNGNWIRIHGISGKEIWGSQEDSFKKAKKQYKHGAFGIKQDYWHLLSRYSPDWDE